MKRPGHELFAGFVPLTPWQNLAALGLPRATQIMANAPYSQKKGFDGSGHSYLAEDFVRQGRIVGYNRTDAERFAGPFNR